MIVVAKQRTLDLGDRFRAPPHFAFHRFTFVGERIRRMVVFSDLDSALAAS